MYFILWRGKRLSSCSYFFFAQCFINTTRERTHKMLSHDFDDDDTLSLIHIYLYCIKLLVEIFETTNTPIQQICIRDRYNTLLYSFYVSCLSGQISSIAFSAKFNMFFRSVINETRSMIPELKFHRF